jgi:hypothetical protein
MLSPQLSRRRMNGTAQEKFAIEELISRIGQRSIGLGYPLGRRRCNSDLPCAPSGYVIAGVSAPRRAGSMARKLDLWAVLDPP